MGGRFLHRLEQRIEGRCGQHVHLVDDIHLVPAQAGGIGGFVPQVTDAVHAVVGGGVDLDHVQDAAVVHAPADGALPAGIALMGIGTVDRLGEDPGTGGFTGAAGAGEQIGVAHPAGGHLVFERGYDRALSYHVLEHGRPPFAVQCLVHRRTPPPQSCTKNGQRPRMRVRGSAYGCRRSAAHRAGHLMLLGSPPDMVHGAPSHRTRIRMPNSALYTGSVRTRYII